MEEKSLSLYVHIPFCVKKCAYCDFLSAPASKEVQAAYVEALCHEIESKAALYPDYRVRTVFFGGGTPTILGTAQLIKILCKLKEGFWTGNGRKDTAEADSLEITIECNPGTASLDALKELRRAGFNRLSLGLQSAQDKELEKLGRIHCYGDFLKSFSAAREAGFDNMNVDIMSALPGQTEKDYRDTLEKVAALRPEHISAYSLMIEEGTPFYESYHAADEQRRKQGFDAEHLLPDEEEERRMYELTGDFLKKAGYHRYEISNYALPGRECRHNMVYWRRGNYLGLGLGAASLMGNQRFRQEERLEEYLEKYRDGDLSGADGDKEKREAEILSVREQMEEFMFLGLRMTEGVSCEAFFNYFGKALTEVYGKPVEKLEQQGLLKADGDRLYLTERGIDVSNVVLAEFLLESG